MNQSDILIEAYGRISQIVARATDGIDAEGLTFRPEPGSNSIGWLVWHLTRVQDDHVSEIAEQEQAWTAEGWVDRFALPLERSDTGYGHSADQVALLRPADATLLTGYHEAVSARTATYLQGVDGEELDRIIDRNWDPPVTVGVRLVSVISDNLQHAGQAAYLRGIIQRTA